MITQKQQILSWIRYNRFLWSCWNNKDNPENISQGSWIGVIFNNECYVHVYVNS